MSKVNVEAEACPKEEARMQQHMVTIKTNKPKRIRTPFHDHDKYNSASIKRAYFCREDKGNEGKKKNESIFLFSVLCLITGDILSKIPQGFLPVNVAALRTTSWQIISMERLK
ncbi:MAG: hypothetical protein Q7J77_03425 [Undibacterium sp.]|nr:hypothetical protein [Undibacterium sp.]